MDQLGRFVADAVLGIDTLWGGDVMCPSGTGRFIADSWFSDEPLPAAYTTPAAARVRETGGVGGKNIDRQAIEAYLRAVDLPSSHRRDVRRGGENRRPARPVSRRSGVFLQNHVGPGHGDARRGQAGSLRALRGGLHRAGRRSRRSRRPSANALPSCWPAPVILLQTVVCWARWMRGARDRITPMASVKALGAAVIAYFDNLSAANLLPYLPKELAQVPRANIDFLPIKDAWFSGSMNYLGRARNADGSPQYEATLRDQRLAADQLSGVSAARQPRSGARTRHHVRLSSEPLRPRPGRLRSHGADHEHARRDACSRASPTTPS